MTDLTPFAPLPGTIAVFSHGRTKDLSDMKILLIRRVEENTCYCTVCDTGEETSFAWRFRDGLNVLHWWPGKPTGHDTKTPGPKPDFSRFPVLMHPAFVEKFMDLQSVSGSLSIEDYIWFMCEKAEVAAKVFRIAKETSLRLSNRSHAVQGQLMRRNIAAAERARLFAILSIPNRQGHPLNV